VPGLRLIGTAPEKASVLTFVLDGYLTAALHRLAANAGSRRWPLTGLRPLRPSR
jgi:hypothetical protein